MIRLLHCATRCNWYRGSALPESSNAFLDEIECAVYTADGVVGLLWAVDGDDDVVEERGYIISALEQQQASSKKSKANSLLAKEVAQSREVTVQERFATRENNMADAKVFERRAVTL